MSIFSKPAKVLTVLSLGLLSTQALAQSENFCNTTGHSGQSVQLTYNTTGEIGGNGYELWCDSKTQSCKATFYADGSMNCQFQGADDYLCRSGLKLQSDGKTYNQYGGDILAEYKLVKNSSSGVDYSYIGVYGWMENVPGAPNGLVEYYIVDNTLSQWMPGSWVGNEQIAQGVSIDGGTYDVYRNTRTGPAIGGTGNKQFYQYFSIRSDMRACGTINVSAHMRKWESLGLKMGKMYEARVLGEAGCNGNGCGANGSMDFPYAKVYISNGTNPSSSSSGPTSSATVERSPYSSNSIPGTIEFENFDYGGEGVGYHNGTYSTDYSPSGYRSEEVEVIGVGSGYGVGYISANDWLEYTVKVASAGTYDFEVTAGTGMSNASVMNVTAGTATAEVSIPATPDDWGTYSATAGTINLAAGKQIIRFTFTSGNVNVDKVKFTKKSTTSSSSAQQSSSSSVQQSSSSSTPSSSSQAPVVVTTLPGTLQFEDYQNSGGEFNNNGTSLGSINPDAWVEYTVNFTSAGAYEFLVHVARQDNDNNKSHLSVSIDGTKVGTVTDILTTGWTDFQDFSTTTSNISAGQHTLRVTFDYGWVDADYMKFTKVSSSSAQQSSSSSEKQSSSSKVQSSSSSVKQSSSSAQVVSSSSVQQSSSSALVVSSSSEEQTSSASEESSSSTLEESSSSTLEISSSSTELWYSSATMAMTKVQLLIEGNRNLQVFDMQGRFLGRVTVAQGTSLEQVLLAMFQKPGIYLVKQGGRFMQVRVTR